MWLKRKKEGGGGGGGGGVKVKAIADWWLLTHNHDWFSSLTDFFFVSLFGFWKLL